MSGGAEGCHLYGCIGGRLWVQATTGAATVLIWLPLPLLEMFFKSDALVWSGKCVFAAHRRHYGAVFFELGKRFVDHFFVKACHFGYFGSVDGLACLTEGFDNGIFLVHDIFILKGLRKSAILSDDRFSICFLLHFVKKITSLPRI